MRAAVILTTYNSPDWLRKVVWGYSAQTRRDFQLVIADDGSDWPTMACIAELRREVDFAIAHVRHENRGFRKCEILNLAIANTEADYLIFSDADCIPRADFVAQHLGRAETGRFLSGGCVRLPIELSRSITKEEVLRGLVTDVNWLRSREMPVGSLFDLPGHGARRARLLDWLTTTRATWNGHNASGWKADIEAVNGFDERMEYGGLDREMGERLVNAGVRPKQIRHRAICVHLDHPRTYISSEAIRLNLQIRRTTRQRRMTWTPFGIKREVLRMVDHSSAMQVSSNVGEPNRRAA